ncbi:MAG TPA: hypothetical protein VGM51_10475 [Armatimonadota bacterium]|jgi:hypothetical protein
MCIDKEAEVFADIPEFASLSEAAREQLHSMSREMLRRGLPPEVFASGLRSTANLLLEQEAEAQSRMEATHVQAFLEANGGRQIARTGRAVPHRESKGIARARLHDRLNNLLAQARTARRRHEVLNVRRHLLGVNQAYVRRILGAEADAVCAEINEWLADAAARLNNGGL